MKRLGAAGLVAAVLAFQGALAAQPRDVRPQVDKIFSRWNSSTAGCAVGVAEKGRPLLQAAYGMADLEHDIPIAPDTIFEAGSVSKQFTAAAVLLLARDGKLSLEDPVEKYVPEIRNGGTPITIRQMLNHTSGLRDWGSLAGIAGWPRGSRVHTHAHVVEILSQQHTLNFAPGTRWSYSNSGYNLAAVIVSRVSGMSFADFTKARIFTPLGMSDTSWRDDYTRIVKRRAVAYSERQGTFTMNMPFENVHGNGGILTTVGDLLKWNENFTTPKVGDLGFVTELQQPGKLNDGRSHGYAFGLFVDTYRGTKQVDHSGGTAGYRAHLARYPERGLSVAVLCNLANADATEYAKAVADLFLDKGDDKPAPPHTLSDVESEKWLGLYRGGEPERPISIVRDGGALRIQNGPPLVAVNATRARIPAVGVTLDFDGARLRLDQSGTVYNYQRVDPAKPTAEQLKALTGRYVSDEIETTLEVALDGDSLVIRRRPNTRIPLTPVYADAFNGPLGLVVFQRSGDRVTDLHVIQDRVWDLKFTRQPQVSGTATQ